MNEDHDDLISARWTGAILGGAIWVALGFLLWGCASSAQSQPGLREAIQALTAAEDRAYSYVILPLCGPTHAPPCSDAMVTAKIKIAAQTAHDAVKGAELAGDAGSLAIANDRIAVLVAATPTT